MTKSALAGCPGCAFILTLARVQHRPELQVLLQRYDSDSNRVNVSFIASPGSAMNAVHRVQLRLCTANGKQFRPPPTCC
jgi:hypothetical protein